MPAKCEKLLSFAHSFEEEGFNRLCRELQNRSGDYTVTSPVKIRGRDIDGLVITASCIFTLEYKHMGGRVEKGLNTELQLFDENNKRVDLSERHEDPLTQVSMQWRFVKDFLRDQIFGVDDIYVKPILIFKPGTRINAPDFQKVNDPYAEAYILALDQVANFVQNFQQPDNYRIMDKKVQATLLKALKFGDVGLTNADKELVRSAPVKGRAQNRTHTPPFDIQDEPPWKPRTETILPPLTKRIKWRLIFISGLAFSTFLIWSSWQASLLLTGLLFILLWREKWKTSLYYYIGGLSFGYLYSVAGWSLLFAIAAASFWPIPLMASVFLDWDINNTDPGLPVISIPIDENILPSREAINTPVIDATETPGREAENEEDPGEIGETEEPTIPPPTKAPPETDDEKVIQVVGNSNVRAEPDAEADIVGFALNDELFTVLESSPGNSWYKIRLKSGVEGWIGSSRVTIQSAE